MRLLRVEGDARGVASIGELMALMANESQLLLRAQQTFVARPGIKRQWEIAAGATLAKVDRAVPLIQSLEQELMRHASAAPHLATLQIVDVWPGADTNDRDGRYPYRHGLWIPLIGRKGDLLAGVLLLRNDGWQSSDLILAQRLSVTFAHSWHWCISDGRIGSLLRFDRRRASIAGVVGVLIALIPVSMTTLAPLEIVARDPFVVAAPIDGVIDAIPVEASAAVTSGQTLVRFVDTALRSRFEVAEREVEVATARVKKVMLAAISDIRSRHELAVVQAEQAVKVAERDYARAMLERSVVHAAKDGAVVLGDKRELIGRPVATGERILEIADPAKVEIRIAVPAGDAIILGAEKRAKIFLDSAPLSSRSATVATADYMAKTQDGGVATFRVVAHFNDDEPPPRLGMRGTAQLYGSRVPLVYYLLRRPLAAARQWIGL